MSDESYPERIIRSTPVAIAAAVVDIAAFVSLTLSDAVRGWVKAHPLLIVVAGLLIILSLVVLTNRLARSRAHLQAEVQVKNAKITDLEARLHPTVRDRENFDRLLSEFPANTGTIPFLENFPGKQWKDKQATPIHGFPVAWRYEFFDDPIVQDSFNTFREKVRDLSDWLGGEGFPHLSKEGTSGLPAPHEFQGGYKEFAAVRDRGQRLAHVVVAARLEVEKVGRSRGL